MKYFMCPQGRECGPVQLLAGTRSKTYWVYTETLDIRENLCNHEVSFSIDAGLKDVLYVKFKEMEKGTRVAFAVGLGLDFAKGEILENPNDKILKVSFPNTLYLSIYHNVNSAGRFEFEFWY